MAKTTFLQTTYNTDTTFRTWINQIHDAIIASGWIRTSDPGQLDLAAALTPTSTGQNRGYVFYQMNDQLQATAPVFLKLGFGSPGGSYGGTNYFSLFVTVGFTRDGTGGFTGNTYSDIRTGASYSTFSNVPSYAAGDGSYLSLAITPSQANQGQLLTIERSRDAVGVENGDGVHIVTGGNYTGASPGSSFVPFYSQYLPRVGTTPGVEWPPIITPPRGNSSGVVGTDVGIYPIYPFFGAMQPPGLSLAGYMVQDIATLTQIPVNRYGVNRNYLALGLPGAFNASSYFCRSYGWSSSTPSGHTTNVGLLMRFE